MTSRTERKIAPGPRGHFLLGHLPELRQDVLQLLMESVQQFGDVVRFRIGPLVIHLLSHPEHIKRVLQDYRHNYTRETKGDDNLVSAVGQSLLTTNGEAWQQRRHLIQPAFHHDQIASLVHVMTDATTSMLERWRTEVQRGRSLDIASEMMRLTYAIIGKSLFSADLRTDAETVEQAMTVLLEETYRRFGTLFRVPEIIPTSRNRRYRWAISTLDRIVYGLIDARRQETDHAPDLLSMLMQARDEETGEGLSNRNLRDEMVTLLAAGHETTANALTWMWYLLSKHPDVERRLHTELASVLGGRTPSLQDLAHLKYTTMVIKEAMRLYPPIWVMQRKVVSDDEIGNYYIPAGSEVTISPYVMHRHPAFWENPEVFDPDRFSDERSLGRPRYAYLPFGGGPRLCVGHHFAMMEAQLITAMVVQAYHLDLVPGHPVEPKPWISLRPRQGLLMTLRQKASHQSLYSHMPGDNAPGARCPAFTVSA